MGDADDPMAQALAAGETARREKRLSDAAAAFARVTALSRLAGDQQSLMHAPTRESQIAADRLDWPQAEVFQREALTLARDLCVRGDLAHVVRRMADILDHVGRHDDAGALHAEMTRLYADSPETPPLVLANAQRSVACHEQAIGHRDRAITLWRELRERYAALDSVFRDDYGLGSNPGVEEADRRLTALGAA